MRTIKIGRRLKSSLAALLLLAAVGVRPVNTQECQPCKDHRTGKLLANGAPSVKMTAAVALADPYRRKASADALKWADAELKKMSLEEKAGQLISVGINARFLNQESAEFKELRRQVEQNHVGGIILFRGPIYESVHLVNRMQQLARMPLLISADLESGSGMRFEDATNFPWNMALGATGNPDYARREGE